ncbi:chromosome segregation protein SMC [Bradyrhizobium centrolobii]|uniref:Chromosome segregation protein SMC n=1 Tax=Bradyrhizobium centrolobii TaxID=1505087 RepID=A0A176Z9M1_9BRAD|nr:AAA family ATPase [Bradyrhizobium centrolobii]OAF16553.1 chromosome segregation protein SMC [Bradyrhizobium centrolobii]
MADAPYFIRTLGLTAFRAFLQPTTFDFSKKRCLAIFAPNGHGKSSMIDALEFMFSKDGTLERLGIRTSNNNAGIVALAHNLAKDAKLTPAVTIGFVTGKTVTSETRAAAGAKRSMPAIAASVYQCFAVSPIIRGYTLRTFVESHTPEQRYADIATWLQLGPLVDLQKNLRALRSQVKAAAEDLTAQKRVDAQFATETANSVPAWDAAAALAHVNTIVLAALDKSLVLKALDVSDAAYTDLSHRAKAEEHQIGLAGLRVTRQAAAALFNEIINEETGATTLSGAVPVFEGAVAGLSKAVATEADERGKAANASFQALWKAVEPFFTEDSPNLANCPVCTTPIAETTAGSADGIRAHIAKHLDELADYAVAKAALDEANAAVSRARLRLLGALPGLSGLLADADGAVKMEIEGYQAAVESWSNGKAPTSTAIIASISALLSQINAKIAEIEANQGEHTYAKAKAKLDRLLELQSEHLLAARSQQELEKLSNALIIQATTISGEIRKKVQALLDTLQKPMNDIYRTIQGPGAAPIRFELPAEDDTNQQRLSLLIDFAGNRPGVQPGGYLSDSQIHSVALALRLAAIKQFNKSAPIIALDDIVTSYDADHRRTIAALIATKFSDCQILITTHDERFFNYLKDQQEVNNWQFTRVIRLDPTHGPCFADHKVSDEMIKARWDGGQSAANEMRQAEEEWLLKICREFGVSLRIRALERAYSYERGELASALASFLKEAKLDPQPVAGVNNRFLASLQKGEIENFGSHFQDGPYGDGSIGDERARWDEFKAFRAQFSCPKCKRTKFQRPITLKKPICAHGGCEAQFEFLEIPALILAEGSV